MPFSISPPPSFPALPIGTPSPLLFFESAFHWPLPFVLTCFASPPVKFPVNARLAFSSFNTQTLFPSPRHPWCILCQFRSTVVCRPSLCSASTLWDDRLLSSPPQRLHHEIIHETVCPVPPVPWPRPARVLPDKSISTAGRIKF